MFTGIVTDIGTVRTLDPHGDLRVRMGTAYDPEGIDLGASIACDGCCLTVVDRGRDAEGRWFDVDVSAESLSKTRLGDWAPGTRVNLERALKVGDELGGHIVSGHVDGTAVLLETRVEGDSIRLIFEAPEGLARYVAPKGSVALNGISLTVNDVDGARFGINVIPHTQATTNLGDAREGDRINMEIDTLARYVARLRDYGG